MFEQTFHGLPKFESPDRYDRIEKCLDQTSSIFEDFAKKWLVPGVSYGIVLDGKLAHSASIGFANVATGSKPDNDTVFRIASMTKSFTAMSILMLRDDGLLALDDPAIRYVPELSGLVLPTSDTPPISIRQLLSMSSGLVEDDPWGDRLLSLDHHLFGEMLAEGVAFDLVPGTAYEYSNLGFAILGRVVNAASGEMLRSFAQRRIFDPIGMTSTTWDADLIPEVKRATGYRVENGSWAIEPPLSDGAFGAMGGIASTISDLAKYIALHLGAWPPRDDDDSGPIRRASLREMSQMHRVIPTFPNEEILLTRAAFDGYGFGLVSTIHRDHGFMVSHSGALPGFSSHMEWLPEHGVGVVALANRTYIPIKLAVRATIDALANSGGLVARRRPASQALIRIQDSVTKLYRSWDDATAEATFLDTYHLDLDDDRRWPDFDELRVKYGPILSVSEVVATGALRGSWTMEFERGVAEFKVMLGATIPSKVQFMTVNPLPEESLGSP